MNENNEFHIPFIKSLFLVAAVTLISLGTARYFISNRFFGPSNTQVFTSSQSQNESEQTKDDLIRSVSH